MGKFPLTQMVPKGTGYHLREGKIMPFSSRHKVVLSTDANQGASGRREAWERGDFCFQPHISESSGLFLHQLTLRLALANNSLSVNLTCILLLHLHCYWRL